jgi:hypothetical protein
MGLMTESTEDTLTKLDINVSHQNADNDEVLTAIWIKVSDITAKNFKVYVGNSTTTELTDGIPGVSSEDFSGQTYYKLEPFVFNDLYVQYDAQLGVKSDNLAVKYQTEDTVNVSGNNFTDKRGPVDAVYTITNIAVTDAIQQTITGFDGYDNTKVSVNGNDVTVLSNDTINVNLTMVSDDKDSSENITKLLIEGVPNGVSVQGADYIGNTLSSTGVEFNGTWIITYDSADTNFDMDADGVSYPVVFLIDGEPAEGNYAVNITAYNQDGIASQTSDTDSFNFIIPSATSSTPPNFNNQNVGSPAVINRFNEDDVPLTVNEDIPFTLDAAIAADVSGSSSFSITIQNVQNCTISGAQSYTVGGETVYVVNGSGTDIEAALAGITVTPNDNFNSQNGELLTLDAVLTTYSSGGQQNTETFALTKTVTPVTDELFLDETLTYFDAGNNVSVQPLEDGYYKIDIQVNTVDAPNYSLVQAADNGAIATDITLNHTGIDGVLSWNGGSVVLDSSNQVATVPSSQLHDLIFTPKADASGTASFDYTLHAQESGASNISSTTGSFSFDVTPVVDGLNLENLAANGVEDNLIEIKANNISLSDSVLMKDADNSEFVQTLSVNNVPDGFLVFYGASGSVVQAQNTGNNGTPNENLWNVPVSGGIAPQVWLSAPKDYSGTLSGIELKTVVGDGSAASTVSTSLDATWTAVADVVSIAPTKTFGDEASTIDLNLNAAMQDIDGSETVTVTLTGNNTTLVDGIIFSAGTTIASSYSNGTYTLTGITFDQLNSIVMTLPEGMKGTFNVDVTAQTIENSNLNTGPIASSSFQMVINSKASGVTTFNASVGDQVNTTITGKTIVNKDHNIALILTDIDLVDKDGSESLTLILKGLTDSLTVDASALTGVTTQKQNDGSWLVELGNPLDGNYNTNLTALANGDIKLVSTSTSGSVDSIEVSAYSTLIQSNEKSSDSPLQNVALNLTVDTNGAIDGTANDDYLVGGAGSDFIDGGLGDDILVGGLGVDTLTGNTGNDKFRISANEDSTDVISDFTDGEDKLDLSEIIGIPAINSSNFNDYIQTSVSGSDLLVQIFENGDGQSSGTPTQSILLNNQSALSLDELDIHQD